MNTRPQWNCDCVFTPARAEALSTPLLVVSWLCRIVAATILIQTLYFKFTGVEESVYIFTQVGVEPWGRFATGVIELFAAGLLLFPRTTSVGALLAVSVMLEAIVSHLARLGIVVKNDGGLLFALALTVRVCSSVNAILLRRQLPNPRTLLRSHCA